MSACKSVVPGCPDCEAEAAFRGDHECSDICAAWGGARSASEEFHRQSHAVHLCEHCGFMLSDKRSPAQYKTRLCKAGYCNEWYCPSCGRTESSAGPIECPACGSGGFVTRARISRMHRAYARRR